MKQQIDWNSANIEDVVKGIGSNSTEAYEEFFNRTVNKAYIIAHKVLGEKGNSADAEDMVQDAYMTAFNNIESLKDPEKAISWFGTIVGNKCKDYLKKNKVILFEEIDTEDILFEDTIENEYQEFIPEKAVDYSETKRLMDEIVDSLPKDQKLCTLLFYYNDLSVREIAEALDCSEGTVKSRLNYSRKKIEDEVKALEKKGTKLYSIAPMPFIGWMLKDAEATVVVPEVIKAQILVGANTGASAATSIAAKTSIAKSVTAGASAAGKTLVTKIVAGVVAASLVIGGGVFVAKTVVEPSPEEVETKIIAQLDYELLENLFYYLPVYNDENPISDDEMYSIIRQGISDTYLAQEIDNWPHLLDQSSIIEVVLDADYEETGYYSYARVDGSSFDEIARVINFNKKIDEEFLYNVDPYYQSVKWDDGTMTISVDGMGSSGYDWNVDIVETRKVKGTIEIDYRLTMTEYTTQPETTSVSLRTAVLKLNDDKYIISSIGEKESTGAISVVESEAPQFTNRRIQTEILFSVDSWEDTVTLEFRFNEDDKVYLGEQNYELTKTEDDSETVVYETVGGNSPVYIKLMYNKDNMWAVIQGDSEYNGTYDLL